MEEIKRQSKDFVPTVDECMAMIEDVVLAHQQFAESLKKSENKLGEVE